MAYYLVHGMGRGSKGDFAERERTAARNFAPMAKAEGIGRVVYLGGLGEPASKHLRSRHETGRILAAEGPPLTYFRAAMVVGAGSESYRTLRYLVQRLPAMIAPAWLSTPTQPIGADDVVEYLSLAAETPGGGGSRGADRGARRPVLRRDAGPDGRGPGRTAPAQDRRPAALTDALLALDRARHAGRRRRGSAAGGGPDR